MSWFDMECNQVQRLLDDLSEGRLPEILSREVRRHVEECTDCRVSQQRAARLQRLLSLKRHEQPSAEYFENFLAGYHVRLRAETEARASWWKRFGLNFAMSGQPTWQYALVGGMAVCLVVGVLVSRDFVSRDMASAGRPVMGDRLPALSSATASSPEIALTPLALLQPINSGSPAITPVDAHDDVSPPRYVLDRLTVTPASYDVPNVHF